MNRGKTKFLITIVAALVSFLTLSRSYGYGEIGEYQLGSQWGKHRVWIGDLEGKSSAFSRAALATAYLNVGATGFYLGKFNGVHVLATNHHVCPVANECVGAEAQFRLLGIKVQITDFIISIKKIDLTLLVITVPPSQELAMAKVARNFAFKQKVYPGEPLMTFGFGIAGNPQNYLVGNVDSDCKVFSKAGDFRPVADPDRFNPVGYSAWSFVHGCDISHGDSGSALVDKRNGAVIGILWSGKFPKVKRVQNSSYLDQLYKNGSEEMWTELNFGIPATIIGETLQDVLYSGGLPSATKSTISALLSDGS